MQKRKSINEISKHFKLQENANAGHRCVFYTFHLRFEVLVREYLLGVVMGSLFVGDSIHSLLMKAAKLITLLKDFLICRASPSLMSMSIMIYTKSRILRSIRLYSSLLDFRIVFVFRI